MFISRQKAVLTAELCLVTGLLPSNAKADISFIIDETHLADTLHTHLYSSPSLPSLSEIQLAAVCFVTDMSECEDNIFGNTENSGGNGGSGGAPDYDLNDAERCRKEGYSLTSCAAGETPEGFCIYNSNYFARCVCPSGYKTCEPPYYGVGQACGNKYASCEEDTERACKELNSDFTDTCQSGWKVDPNNTCEYDATFGKCCNLCEGYDYTSIPEGYIADGTACVDCSGTSKYKIKINPCDGFQDCGIMGGKASATTCQSGDVIKYDNCKPCPNLGTLSSCPSPFTCTYEECSNSYYKSGCQSGYDWNASSQTCTPQCASTYQYTCTGTGYSGGSGTACGGKYAACTCASGYKWKNGCIKISNAKFGQCNGYAANCSLGDILFSDGTCNSNKVSGKTPIAVVVHISDDGCGQAMGLTPNTDIPFCNNINSNIPNVCYKPDGTSYPCFPVIDRCSYRSDGGIVSSFTEASKDTKSCANTSKLSDVNIVNFINKYETAGTKAGDWCLPAAGIITSIYNNQSKINTGFSRAGGTQFTNSTYAWTSTSIQEGEMLSSDFSQTYGLKSSFNTDVNDFRPVIEF